MLRNYIKIAFRNIAKYKVFSFISTVGMAVSLASCLLIALFVLDELRYDHHHPDGSRPYRIYNIVNHHGVESYLAILPYVVAPAIYCFAQQWLSNFVYRTEIDVWLFVKAVEVILAITIFTVSFQSLKAALTNPVENLKSE